MSRILGCLMMTTFRARVTAVHKDRWEILPDRADEAAAEPVTALLPGRFRQQATGPEDLPVVGDWVTATRDESEAAARITGVEPRSGLLARKRPGDVRHDAVVEQAIAANIDVALLVMAIDGDFSVHRLERYLTLAWDSAATPVVVLTKADLATAGAPDVAARVAQAEAVAFGSRIVVTSARTGQGLAELRSVLPADTCAVLLGSSGVGKSSLLNALADRDVQMVSEVRQLDGKGRHTTTARRLVTLPWGAFLVDTPGLRELQLWADEESLSDSFPDVGELAATCRFSDCAHETEPGCAVLDAVAAGTLAPDRLESWRRLRRELAHLQRRTDKVAARAQRDRWKVITKQQRSLKKQREERPR